MIEGSGPGDMACIDIAELQATAVDLGTLAAGTWTISAEGDAPAIKLEVALTSRSCNRGGARRGARPTAA